MDPTRNGTTLHERIASGPLDARRGQRTDRVAATVGPAAGHVEPLDQALMRRLRALQMCDAARTLRDVRAATDQATALRQHGKRAPHDLRSAHDAPDRDPLRALLVDRPYPGV